MWPVNILINKIHDHQKWLRSQGQLLLKTLSSSSGAKWPGKLLLWQSIQLLDNTANSLLYWLQKRQMQEIVRNAVSVMSCLKKPTASTAFVYRRYMSHNWIVPFKISRGINLFPCQGKEKLGVALGRAHGVSYRSFKIAAVQLPYSGNLCADDVGLLKSTMEM